MEKLQRTPSKVLFVGRDQAVELAVLEPVLNQPAGSSWPLHMPVCTGQRNSPGNECPGLVDHPSRRCMQQTFHHDELVGSGDATVGHHNEAELRVGLVPG